MKTIAERFKYYANHPDYIETRGMCRLLKSEGEAELLEEVVKYMEELGSCAGRTYLYRVIEAEGWDITCKEIYGDWDNRPYPEDMETFEEVDEVEWRGSFGEVARVSEGPYSIGVYFEGGEYETFTRTGRRVVFGPRELRKRRK